MSADEATELPDDWDPNPAERSYFSHYQTGDFGWLVRRDGKDVIKLDRPGVDEIRTFDERQWVPKHDVRPLQPAHVAQIAFMADKQLCLALGLYEHAKVEWLSLSQEKRRAWIEKGPQTPEVRKKLYAKVMEAVADLTAQ